jgi:RNA polymerase sigma-70 factor (ECF subfamily)
VYLIFTTGYAMGPAAGLDLCEEALFLARLLNDLRPEDPEIEGALALILITHARSAARATQVRIIDQNRSLWNAEVLAIGVPLVKTAMQRRRIGPFQIKAAIAACHIADTGPDWPQITALYATLLRFEDTPIVRLSFGVALGETQGAQAGLAAIAPLGDELSNYAPFHAAHADFLASSGDTAGANAAYLRAMALSRNPADTAFLAAKCAKLHS